LKVLVRVVVEQMEPMGAALVEENIGDLIILALLRQEQQHSIM